jgi:DNA-binding winged helix-turn-helix (wHTH) protein/tetratricopeptide (TPR) repeat protein
MEVTFGPFSVDLAAARVVRDGDEVRMRPRAFQVLRVLLRHRGTPVGYEQMIAEAWEGTFVSRHTVDVTVAEVRKSLGEYGRWILTRPKVGFSLDIPSSDELVRIGWHLWGHRTREGGERAVECFGRAAEECPGDFRAWEGLSASYLMLAIFGIRPPREMYPGFIAAHQRAVELAGPRPELRCNLAFAWHMFERRAADAERELRVVIADRPGFATAYMRLAMVLGSIGRGGEAVEALAACRRADPLLPTGAAAEVVVHVWRRDFATAADLGARTVELHPYQHMARVGYGEALRGLGRYDAALAQFQQAATLSPDIPWLRTLESACLADLGRPADALVVLEELEARRSGEYVDACHMAAAYAALGRRDRAFAELERACEENSAWLYSLDVDPKMDALRDDPRFAGVRATVIP